MSINRRPWCVNCNVTPIVDDGLEYCPEPRLRDRPKDCPLTAEERSKSHPGNKWCVVVASLLVIACCGGAGYLGSWYGTQDKTETAPVPVPFSTGIALYKQVTVLRPSYLTEQDIESLINSNVKYKALRGKGIGAACKLVEKTYGIGADVVFALVCHESDCGNGNFVNHPTYGVLNNYMSLGVYEGSPTKYKKWATPQDNIMDGGALLHNAYLNPSDWRYKGGLLEDIAVYYVGGDKEDDATWYSGVYGYMDVLDKWSMHRYSASKWESIVAKRKAVGARILCPTSTLPDYWSRPMTREELVIILERITNQ